MVHLVVKKKKEKLSRTWDHFKQSPSKRIYKQATRLCFTFVSIIFLLRLLLPNQFLHIPRISPIFYRQGQPPEPPKSTLSLPTKEYQHIIRTFLSTVPHAHYRSDRMHFLHNRNKTFTCAIVTISRGQARVEWSKAPQAKNYYHKGRLSVLEQTMKAVTSLPHFPYNINVTVLVDLTDGGGAKRPVTTTFATARVWRAWTSMIPVPMGSTEDEDWWNISSSTGTSNPVVGWDRYVQTFVVDKWKNYPWYSKESKAVFRGALKVCTFVLGSCNWENQAKCQRTAKWSECARGVLFKKVRRFRSLFDVAFTKWIMKKGKNFHQFDGAPLAKNSIAYADFQKYKFILNVGSNHDWSDRLRSLMFMNSVVVQHMAENAQFFTPLLKPWVHYIPFSLNMSDLEANVRYAARNDALSLSIRDAQYAFARRYLSEAAMLEYWRIAIVELAKRQKVADNEAAEELVKTHRQPSINLRHNHHNLENSSHDQLDQKQHQAQTIDHFETVKSNPVFHHHGTIHSATKIKRTAQPSS